VEPVSLVAVEATIVLADASKRDEVIAETVPVQLQTRSDEPGCLAYCFAADPVRPDTIQAYELWESVDALDAHLHHEYYFAMRKLLGAAGIASFRDRKHLIEKSAPVYGPDMTPSGRFD